MENNKNLKEEIADAVRGEFRLFYGEFKSFKNTLTAEVKNEIGSIKGDLQLFKNEVNGRFDNADVEIRKLGVMIEVMDDKFSLVSEGQDAIREVLETRVAHIEEVLEVNSKV